MNFLTYPPIAWQFDGEYDSFTVVCERETDRETETEKENKGEEEERGEGHERGKGRRGGGEKWGERESVRAHQLAKKADLQSLLKNVSSLSGHLH